jgi:imidazolonepropionase-like amidohydrolase
MLELIGRMHKAGVPLLAGTDNWAGFALHRELELYVKAGIPAAEVLRIATWNGARYTGTAAQSGSIEPGKQADLVLVDGDPSVDISDIRKISLVLKGGVAFAPAEMYEAVGVRPFVPAAAITPRPR